MADIGRPVEYSDEQIEAAIHAVSVGNTLKSACLASGISEGAARMRIIRDDRLSELYARARESYADVMTEKLNDIATEEDDPQRARLKCDNVKWYASKVLPKKYGDKIQHTGDGGGPIAVNVYIPDNGRN